MFHPRSGYPVESTDQPYLWPLLLPTTHRVIGRFDLEQCDKNLPTINAKTGNFPVSKIAQVGDGVTAENMQTGLSFPDAAHDENGGGLDVATSEI